MITLELIRQFRLGGYAIFDFAVAFLGVYLLSSFLSKIFLKFRIAIPKQNWLFLTLPISVFVHLAIGKITPLTKGFLDPNGSWVLKLVILGLFILGIKGIKIIKEQKRLT